MSRQSNSFNPFQVRIPKKRDLAKLLDKFESVHDARTRKAALVAHLRSAHSSNLAARLATCDLPGRRRDYCLSAGCPVCLRAMRRWFYSATKAVADRIELRQDSGHLVATVIPSNLQFAPGQLSKLNLLTLRSHVWRSLAKANISTPVIGGVDVSFNEDARGIVAPHWQVHVAFAVLGAGSDAAARKQLVKAIGAGFDLEPTAKEPLKVQQLKNPAEQLSYLLKALFLRRVSIIDKRGHRNTLPNPPGLKRPQLVELSEWLATHALTDRLILYRARRVGIKIVANVSKRAPK